MQTRVTRLGALCPALLLLLPYCLRFTSMLELIGFRLEQVSQAGLGAEDTGHDGMLGRGHCLVLLPHNLSHPCCTTNPLSGCCAS